MPVSLPYSAGKPPVGESVTYSFSNPDGCVVIRTTSITLTSASPATIPFVFDIPYGFFEGATAHIMVTITGYNATSYSMSPSVITINIAAHRM